MMRIKKHLYFRVAFIASGLASTVWFLLRVVPKPSRAGYPCMRAAAPVMSAFILYMISLSGSLFALKKFKGNLVKSRYTAAAGFLAVALVISFISITLNNTHLNDIQLRNQQSFAANEPIGIARGIHPGRVVWVWDNKATDEGCTNTTNDYWFDNTDAAQVDSMLEHGIKELAGISNIQTAWDSIFYYFNRNHGKGNTGYVSGEKVYIKINLTNSCCSVNGTSKVSDFERMDATPELCLALLRQLIDVVGIAESDIYIGDPFRTFHDLYWDMCHSVYPDVNYCDAQGMNGRHKTVATDTSVIKFSNGAATARIPSEYMTADYFINMPCLKTHNEGAITLTAKNHQGSILEEGTSEENQSAFYMHPYLPANDPGTEKYRHMVDYMGHNKLGGNTLIFIVDGIWSGRSWEGWVEKWKMKPFNNDYTSSLFLSQDEVAIQSVCYDFLLEEYKNKDADIKYPYMDGADDFLLQAADPANWPAGIQYDPEGDGTLLGSLGVYEHWNNANDKQYSRNLSSSGEGIELVQINLNPPVTDGLKPFSATDGHFSVSCYPVPSTGRINFDYKLENPGQVKAEVVDQNGSFVAELRNRKEGVGSQQLTWDVSHLSPGIYYIRLKCGNEKGEKVAVSKFIVK